MPRGIPNVRRDESQGMRYTAFHVPQQYVPIAHTVTPLSNLYLQTQPKAHEHVISQIREQYHVGSEGGAGQNYDGRAPTRGASSTPTFDPPSTTLMVDRSRGDADRTSS